MSNVAGNGFLKGGKLKIIITLTGVATVTAVNISIASPPDLMALEALAAMTAFYILGFVIEKFLTRQVFNADKTNEANISASETVDAMADSGPATLTDSE
jgi:hypothetical protein